MFKDSCGTLNPVRFTDLFFIFVLCLTILSCSTTPQERTPSSSSQRVTTREQERIIFEHQEQYHESYFDWPVDQARFSRGFLPHKRRPHLGIDLAGPKGTPILAAHSGKVIYTGQAFSGFGKLIMIEGQRGWATFYAHLSKIQVSEGDRVKKGDVIGLMGRTGRATGVHLHFEIRGARGPVDPLMYLPAGQRLARN